MNKDRISKKNNWRNKIIHVDMDAFFAAIEQRDFPELRGKPVVVGGDPERRGVVSTCSYEARKFGIHSAMPARTAHRLCPQAVFLRPRFQVYKEVSHTIMSILGHHTDLVESVSLDEAYLDVTRHRYGLEDPVLIAQMIQQHIRAATRLTASAGVAENLFLAKIASDFHKPAGLTVIEPGQAPEFLADLPVRRIPGVGKVTETRLKEEGIHTCRDLSSWALSDLEEVFGAYGRSLFQRAQGEDDREVIPYSEPKQSSSEETFEHDTRDVDFMNEKIGALAEEVYEDLVQNGRMGMTVVLKVKYFDFEQITRSRTLAHMPASAGDLSRHAQDLLATRTEAGRKPVRLLGVGLSGLKSLAEQRAVPQTADLFAGLDSTGGEC